MDKKLELYKSLADLFSTKDFSLYLVGGTVRDYLLNKQLDDMDLVTDATPNEMKEFLSEADYTFERFGSVKLKYQDVKFDITTLRKEDGYIDNRHPNKIVFTKSLQEDVTRRDITINALYMDKDLKVIDFVNGQKDLSSHLIRMVGSPQKRIDEDPLRIIRIYRFQLETGFDIEEELKRVINSSFEKVKLLNVDKIKQEVKKSHHQEELIKLLKSHGIMLD